jgi:hypothetical protein
MNTADSIPSGSWTREFSIRTRRHAPANATLTCPGAMPTKANLPGLPLGSEFSMIAASRFRYRCKEMAPPAG